MTEKYRQSKLLFRREWAKRNRKHLRDYNRKYYQENQDILVVKARMRREKKKLAQLQNNCTTVKY